MTAKNKSHVLNGMHTAGIFSDMSVDGPPIGTLVVVVDRAKNLPNRKTIGKQDPYCAARLGKEAKKTTTDIRGGQTPKWDQELRFTVHDSPDYYQLKVSVFNDDKKTELIGDTWIDLRDIIVTGGGQNDLWHQLSCKGKYAGEVRIEVTFYDSRPKPEKPAVKAKPPTPAEPEGGSAGSSAAGPRSMPKRRPLPSDPVTGKAPTPPAPEQVETPPRPQPQHSPVPPPSSSQFAPTQPPPQQLEYNTPPPQPAPAPARYQQQPEHYSPGPQGGAVQSYGTPSRQPADMPVQQYRTPERADKYAVHPDDRAYSQNYQQQQLQSYDRHDPRPQDQYDLPQLEERRRTPEEDRPPPPPAHRSRNGSNGGLNAMYQSSHEVPTKGTPPTMRHDVLRNEAHRQIASTSYPGRPTYKAYDSAPAALTSSQYSNPDQPSPPRHYSYDSSYDPSHRSMQATVEDVPESPDAMNNSFRRGSGSRMQPQRFEPEYDMSASPAPLSLGGSRGNAAVGRYSAPLPDQQHPRQPSNGYMPSSNSAPPRDYNYSETSMVPYRESQDQRGSMYRSELDDTSNGYGLPAVPPSLVPGIDPSIALEIAQRLQERDRQHQRRYTQPAPLETPPRGRTISDYPPRYDQDNSPTPHSAGALTHGRSPITYSGGPSTPSLNIVVKQRNHSPNPVRDPSPNPRHTIKRKSISPAPPPVSDVPFGPDSYNALNPSVSAAATKDSIVSRPDYDELSGKIITHDGREVDPSDHLPMESWAPEPEPKNNSNSQPSSSGRPSLSGAQPMPASGRRPLRIAGRPQSMVPTSNGGNPSAQYTFSTSPVKEPVPAFSSTAVPTATTVATTGRNRLQKKAHRASVPAPAPAPLPLPFMSGANGPGPNDSGRERDRRGRPSFDSTPLAPLPSQSHQDNYTPPRQLTRAATFDYPSENHAPSYGSGSGFSPGAGGGGGSGGSGFGGRGHGGGSGGSGGFSSAPPIPAKIPLALPAPSGMSGALQLHSSSAARRAQVEDTYDDGYDNYNRYDEYRGLSAEEIRRRKERDDEVYGRRRSGGDEMWGGGGGGGGYGNPRGSNLSLEEELQRIDIGTGRSRRHGQGY
ncbi:ingression protein fic1 [Diplogelasinospora grovesii]|uniref:Ingression protein fic1 n=1 Tax=Diplogelasinospora grovesii TaxID=303347 RepID=A0AAN6S6H7_9PEZI|nr:ingression protein fic1 [Diplogelasinospora grovesii]